MLKLRYIVLTLLIVLQLFLQIDTCNGFYCDQFKPISPKKPKQWTENWPGWYSFPLEYVNIPVYLHLLSTLLHDYCRIFPMKDGQWFIFLIFLSELSSPYNWLTGTWKRFLGTTFWIHKLFKMNASCLLICYIKPCIALWTSKF